MEESQTHLLALLKEKDEKIKELYEEKKKFLRVVSHDLRSPISRIIGFSDLLKKDLADNEDLQPFALNIEAAGWTLSNMIARIMEVEEFEQDDRELSSQEIDLSQSLESIIADFGPESEKKNISIEWSREGTNFLTKTDKPYFDLIFTNLISNAIKFSPKGAKVEVKLQSFDDTLAVAIHDQGPGFKDEEKHLIFKKFTKLSAKPTMSETATGLGLYVVKKCVDSLKYELDIHSNAEGTKVKVQLPKA